jgi:hypothetical protein
MHIPKFQIEFYYNINQQTIFIVISCKTEIKQLIKQIMKLNLDIKSL